MLLFVARENIRRFERLLACESEPARRAVLTGLMDRERGKLLALGGYEGLRPRR